MAVVLQLKTCVAAFFNVRAFVEVLSGPVVLLGAVEAGASVTARNEYRVDSGGRADLALLLPFELGQLVGDFELLALLKIILAVGDLLQCILKVD